MSAPDIVTKPCPNCAKPLRPDAANCWFCGSVFDTLRCVECGSPNRTVSPACQICGEPLPSSPLLVAASDTPPTTPPAREQDCPGCGGPVPLAAIRCKHCGGTLPKAATQWSKAGNDRPLTRARGGGLIALALISILWLIGTFTPGLMLVLLTGNHGVAVFASLSIFGGGFAGCAVFLAVNDLSEMDAGRKNQVGRATTSAAGWLGGVSILVYVIVLGVFLSLAQ